jgi:hypothetical protein
MVSWSLPDGVEAHEAAKRDLRDGLELIERTRGPGDRYTVKVLEGLVGLYRSWDRPEQAAQYRARIEASSRPASRKAMSGEAAR